MAGSASFNSQAVAVGIRGTAGVVRIPGAEGILNRVRRIRRAVAAVGVAGRVRVVRIRAQLTPVLTLLIVEPWGVRRIGIGGRLIAKGIVQAVRLEGSCGSGEMAATGSNKSIVMPDPKFMEPPSVTTRKECRFRCLFPHPSRQSPQTATEKDEGILPPPACARENVRHSISDNKCCRAASTCSVPTSA